MTEEQRKAQEEESKGSAEAASASEEESEEEGEETEEEGEETEEATKPGGSQTKLWIAVGIGVLIAILLVVRRGSNDTAADGAEVGSTVTGDLTLVAADRDELDCAAEKGVGNYLCGFADENKPRQIDEAKKLRPYMTIDRHLYLIPGLFTEKAVQQRHSAEQQKARADQKRFTAKCKIKVMGEVDNVKLRWNPTGSWEPPKKFPVATVSDCTIEG